MGVLWIYGTQEKLSVQSSMPLQTKKAVGLQDIREKIGNLQVDEKELTFGKHICAGPPRNNGTEKVVHRLC